MFIRNSFLSVVLLILSLNLVTYAQNQSLTFRHFSDEQGLSNATINKIVQDHYGFIWIATPDGLNRYDGYNFEIYRNDSHNLKSLSNDYIKTIFEDKNGFWVGTRLGLNRFDRLTHSFYRYIHDPARPETITNNIITSLASDRSGNLWVGTWGGVDCLIKGTNKFLHYRHTKSSGLNNDTVNVVYCDKSGMIWAGTINGLSYYDPHIHHFRAVHDFTESITAIQEQDDKIWLGTEFNGLFLWNRKSKEITGFQHSDSAIHSLGSNMIKDILIDHAGKLWIGCINGGLNLFNPQNRSFSRYEREPGNNFSLSQKSVFCLFEDQQHNLWIGAPRGGVNIYVPDANQFKLFRQNRDQPGLPYDDVRAFYQDKNGIIWIGTDGGGLSLFSQKRGFVKTYKHNSEDPYSLGSDAILNITGDRQGKIWISTYGGGISVFDYKRGGFINYRHNAKNKYSLGFDYVTKVLEDSQSNVWVATSAGLEQFDTRKNQFRRIIKDPEGKTSCWGRDFIDINEDKSGNLWFLSLDGGVNRYNISEKRFRHYLTSKPGTTDIAVGFTDSKNNFWVGKKGLYQYNRSLDRFEPYKLNQEIGNIYIKAIEEDNSGNLWLSTSHGITKLDPKTGHAIDFNTVDGLQGLEFEVKSALKTFDGEMYFGGVNGFNSFYPNKININHFNAPVFITGLEIFNQPVEIGTKNSPLKTDISLTSAVRLSYKQTSISFSFAALNFVNSQNNTYSYKLDGFDKNWINSGKNHKATYTNLNPGTYVFHVRAANNNGIWSSIDRRLTIIIPPPFWLTWWFEILVAMLFLFIAYRYIKFRHEISIKKVEDRKNEEMHQLQLQFFTNISHEFRTPLSLILGPLERLKETEMPPQSVSYFQTIERNAGRLFNLINELLDFSKVISGATKLKVHHVDLKTFLREMVNEFEQLSRQKRIELQIEDIKNTFFTFDPVILEKIVLNLLSNAYKFTSQNALIRLEVFLGNENRKPAFQNELVIKSKERYASYFYIKVIDNGTGISKDAIGRLFERYFRVNSSHMGSGLGLAFVKSLTLLHKGDIYVSSEINKGTEIIIALPAEANAYTAEEQLREGDAEYHLDLESKLFKVSDEFLEAQDNKNGARERVLLIEDNKELRRFYKSTLNEKYHVIEADNGLEGYQIIKNQPVDLIITDVMMPLMDGMEFCNLIRSDIDTSHIPLIMLTAKTSVTSQIEGVESGADLYLSKPVSLRLLHLSVTNIFSQRRKLRDLYIKNYYAEAKDLANTIRDREFLEKLCSILESQIINSELDVDYVCQEIGMSRTKLYHKIKSITGQSIVEFIRSYRLKKAIQIMTHEDVSINEVIFRVGIQTHSHFTKSFKKEYGKTPSQFLQEIQRKVS